MNKSTEVVNKDFDFDNEISLYDVIQKSKEYFKEFRRNWLLVIVFCAAFVGWYINKSLNTPSTYKASLTFMVDDEKSSGIGGIGAVLGNFGLGGSESNLDKVLALSKSMRIIRSAFFTKVKINGDEDFIANHIINYEKLREKAWAVADPTIGNILLNDFVFKNDSFPVFSRKENAALKKLFLLMLGESQNGIFSSSLDKKSGIMSLDAVTQSEELSIQLVKAIYTQLSDFYILSSVNKETQTYEILRQKSDSIKALLSGTEFAAAKFKDKNNALLLNSDQLPSERYARNKALYGMIYGESIKNLEIADFALKTQTPYIQILDEPIPPIKANRYGLFKALFTGLVLGLITSLIFISVRFTIQEALRKGQNR
jgi:hypothetical protein